MKRRRPAPRVKSTQKKVTFLKSQDLLDAAHGDILTLGGELKLYDADGKEMDCSAQPRAKTCGICNSPKVTNYAMLVAAQHPTDDELMLTIVLGVCGSCEELGPDVFLPEMARRLQEEARS